MAVLNWEQIFPEMKNCSKNTGTTKVQAEPLCVSKKISFAYGFLKPSNEKITDESFAETGTNLHGYYQFKRDILTLMVQIFDQIPINYCYGGTTFWYQQGEVKTPEKVRENTGKTLKL